ncbi:MAG: phosphoribosylglycinamide formyltransferase [Methanomicrobiales archaeon]|jgi:phosphoribosylglycinamide formyltransferase-1|nr:phosphoribosylglycinamide formyltransferase [Methanomicrobiales archaeon]MDD1648106.1 phosphoribosylglycinamide formyltransferase [Methanomicrobiales archaeon]
MKGFAVMASGRGSNFQALIDAMKEGTLPACCLRLITDNPSAYAIERAEKAGIPVTVLDYASYPDRSAYEQALLREMRATGADLFVLAGYMRILDREIVEAFPRRILNIHPALLPSFPGLHAQRQALEHGVRVSGCSVHLVDSGTDTGPIILQRCVRVEQDDTEESLADRILEEEHRILPEAVRLFMEGRLNVQGRRVRIR